MCFRQPATKNVHKYSNVILLPKETRTRYLQGKEISDAYDWYITISQIKAESEHPRSLRHMSQHRRGQHNRKLQGNAPPITTGHSLLQGLHSLFSLYCSSCFIWVSSRSESRKLKTNYIYFFSQKHAVKMVFLQLLALSS